MHSRPIQHVRVNLLVMGSTVLLSLLHVVSLVNKLLQIYQNVYDIRLFKCFDYKVNNHLV